jgi:prepilin-type N-terminal cleavage/methylation domain-containing protein
MRARYKLFCAVILLRPSSAAHHRPRARAFTLVELLVVVAIVGLLVALLLPGVQQSRESARRSQCTSNLRQIGISLANYHAALLTFPPGCTDRGTRQVAWSMYLLPFLEEQSVRDMFNPSYGFRDPQNQAAGSQLIAVYLCPSTNRLTADRQGNYTGSQVPLLPANRLACSDYGGMFGAGLYTPSQNGVLIYERTIRQRDITDGLSHTIIVAEDSGRGLLLDGPWADGENIFDSTVGINVMQDNEIWSDHPGGAVVLMCDCSVRFLEESVPPTLLAPLCTRANGDGDALTK